MTRLVKAYTYLYQSSVLSVVQSFKHALFPVSSYFPMCLEVPGGPRRLWLLVGLQGPWLPEFPWGPGFLGLLVCHRSLGLLVVPLSLADLAIPQYLLVPRDQGSQGYLGFLVRKSKHHYHKVRVVSLVECPTRKKSESILRAH